MYKFWKPKILLAMVIFGLSAVNAEVPKNNLLEAEVLLKSLAYDEKAGDIKIYLWQLPGVDTNIIEWNEDASDYTDEGFVREGTLSIANGGKITHRKVGEVVEPGKWKLWLLGDKQKIIKAKLIPDTISLEKPALYMDTVYMQEKIICKEAPKEKIEAIFVKFPGKLPFWMEVQTSISSKGSMSSYVITYDEKSPCIADKERQEREKKAEEQQKQKAEELERKQLQEQNSMQEELKRLRAAEVKRVQSQQQKNHNLGSGTVDNSTNNVSNSDKCTYYTVTLPQLNIRDKPQKPSNILGKAYKGDKLCIYGFSGKWGRSKYGWLSGKYLKKYSKESSKKIGIVRGLDPYGDGFLSLRSKPKGREIAHLYNGDRVQILSRHGQWYKLIKINTGQSGWAHRKWISVQ